MLYAGNYNVLHWDFVKYLDEIVRHTRQQGGELVSRQVIALAIVTWQRMNPSERIRGDG